MKVASPGETMLQITGWTQTLPDTIIAHLFGKVSCQAFSTVSNFS